MIKLAIFLAAGQFEFPLVRVDDRDGFMTISKAVQKLRLFRRELFFGENVLLAEVRKPFDHCQDVVR